VAILSRNSHAFAALRFALARLGAVLVPINFMLNADEVAYILRHAGARAVRRPGHARAGRAAAARTPRSTRLVWLPGEDPAQAPAGRMRDFDALLPTTPAPPQPSSTQHACCRSSTPAAPSRCPRARC
jgi:fatty-acyl-CoA synthase